MALGRRDFLKAATIFTAGSALTAGVALATETDDLRLERVEIHLPGLHPSHDGVRVAQLSDVHVGPFTPAERVRVAIAAVNAFAPDLTVLTGDYVTSGASRAGALREQLAGIRSPTVAVLGNHDHRVDPVGVSAALEALGYAVLRNENTALTLRGEPFTVVGIDDLKTRHADPERALRGAREVSRLCLAHNPETVDLLQANGPALVLSGHTHGGQLNVPGLWTLAGLRYKSGLYKVGRARVYVNRGVGNILVSLRIAAPPEVTLFTVRADDADSAS